MTERRRRRPAPPARVPAARVPPGRALAALALAGLLAACGPTQQPMGPAVQAPTLDDAALTTADGTRLPLLRVLPDVTPAGGRPRAVVLGLHGFNDYANTFATAATGWARSGIATYAYDQRGFGAAPQRGIWPGTDTLVADAEAAFTLVRQRHPGVPVFVVGESMGASVALAAVGRGGLAAAAGFVMMAPAVRDRASFPRAAQIGFEALTWTMPWLAGAPPPLGFRPTDNPTTIRLLQTDPLIQRSTRVDTVWGLVNLMDDAVAAAPAFARPVLIAVGRRDNIVPEDPVRGLVERMPPAGPDTRRVALYRSGFHLLTRDRDGPVVIADIATWMLTRATAPATPLPSGADRESW